MPVRPVPEVQNVLSETVLITVQDTGIGISAEALERLFQPFTQADSKTARNFGGTGLGLAIVERIVTDHGGTLDIESEPGGGTRVRLLLPVERSD